MNKTHRRVYIKPGGTTTHAVPRSPVKCTIGQLAALCPSTSFSMSETMPLGDTLQLSKQKDRMTFEMFPQPFSPNDPPENHPAFSHNPPGVVAVLPTKLQPKIPVFLRDGSVSIVVFELALFEPINRALRLLQLDSR
ncbi:hypothetical protein Bbelb_155780 [Branchiostoma belcheri]|nr:hypothetical protein Bbelb_155780 [Branchiostoma belcheri]